MPLRRALIFALLAAFFGSASALADDVLFIGLNAAYHEMIAARKAAEKTGRHLVVFPDLPDVDWKRYYDLNGEEHALVIRFQKACAGSEQDPKCVRAKAVFHDRSHQIQVQRAAFLEKATFNEKRFADFLSQRQQEKKTFSSVVVSGHDGTGTLSGDFGAIRADQYAELLAQAGQRDSVRAIHLWGCYTASPSSVMIDWKQNFPNIQFVAGYDGRAPLADKPAGWNYLQGVIEREDKLIQMTDAKKLQAALKAIPGAIQLNAGIANCDSYANMKEAFEISELQHQCVRYEQELKAAMPRYECFLHADAGCEDVPVKTDAGTLRDFYGITQKAEICRKITPSATFEAHSRDEALRLLFYRGVTENFGRLYGEKLREVDEALELLGAPADLRFANVSTATRADMLRSFNRLGTFIDEHFRNYEDNPLDVTVDAKLANLYMLRGFFRVGTNSLAKLSDSCVPYSWHEAGSKERLSCIQDDDLGRVAVAQALGSTGELKRFSAMETSKQLHDDLAAGKLGQSLGDQLVYRARLEAYNPDLIGPSRDQAADALAWAEKVRELEKAGSKNPTEDPRALELLYRASERRLQREKEALSANAAAALRPEDQAFFRTAAKTADEAFDALRLKRSLLAPELSSEEQAAILERLRARETSLALVYGSSTRSERTDSLKSAEQELVIWTRLAQRNPADERYSAEVQKYQAQVDRLRSEVEEAGRDLTAYGLRQVNEKLYAAPVKLGPLAD